MTSVIFIILNYKTYRDTIRVTEDILAFGNPNYRIVIVDNLSPNESHGELIHYFGGNTLVDVISSGENGGYAKGNNFGLRFAEQYNSEYVCIINNDVYFNAETIEALVSYYQVLPSPAIISPLQALPDGTIAQFGELKIPSFIDDLVCTLPFVGRFFIKTHVYKENIGIPNIQQVELIPGAFIFIKFEVFKSLGYFDERTFLFCEERFLACKIKKVELKSYLLLNCLYVHNHSTTINQEASQHRQIKMLYESRVVYTKAYRTSPRVKMLCLSVAYYIYVIVRFLKCKSCKLHCLL